jgi:hypothetical protein
LLLESFQVEQTKLGHYPSLRLGILWEETASAGRLKHARRIWLIFKLHRWILRESVAILTA